MGQRARLDSVAILFVLVACAKAEAPPAKVIEAPPAPIRTDQPRYVLRQGRFGPETTIVTTFTAPDDKTVYVVHCNDALSMGLQRLVEGKWVNAWGASTNGCFSPPIVIPPGGRHTSSMFIAPRSGAVLHPSRDREVIEPGTYRAVWYGVLTTFDPAARTLGEELPLEQRVSAPFVIEAPV